MASFSLAQAKSTAQENANKVKAEIEVGIISARTIAIMMEETANCQSNLILHKTVNKFSIGFQLKQDDSLENFSGTQITKDKSDKPDQDQADDIWEQF